MVNILRIATGAGKYKMTAGRRILLFFMIFMMTVVVTMMSAVNASAATAVSILVNTESGSRPVEFSDTLGYPVVDENSRVLCPLRTIGDALGLDINWNDEEKIATFTYDETILINDKTTFRYVYDLSFQTDSTELTYGYTIYVNDEVYDTGSGTKEMDTAPVNVGSRLYAPVKYIALEFGYEIEWDDDNKVATITGFDDWLMSYILNGGFDAVSSVVRIA